MVLATILISLSSIVISIIVLRNSYNTYKRVMAKKRDPYKCPDCGRNLAYVGCPCINEFCPNYYLNLEKQMAEPAYVINDKRGKEEPRPCCRVCGSPEEHSKTYNQPTMSCIEYLRKQISDLKRKNCYNCGDFTIKDGTIPWCEKLNKETNALAPTCQGKS